MCDRLSSVLSAETWPFSIEYLPEVAYLVGGAVRDALLNRRREYLDLDFVLPIDAVNTAKKIANQYQAGFVLLDSDRQIARVVFKQATVDFAQQEGDSIETDLHRRDFTLNAIAYNPRTSEIIDPLQGYTDLQKGIIKMVSPANLQDDPLRLLRAYRQAAQLGFIIHADTRRTIRELASQIRRISPERVQAELAYLLNCSGGINWIIAAGEDGLLPVWFPNATPQRLCLIAEVEYAASKLAETWPDFPNKLSKLVGDGLKISWLSMAKLASLLSFIPELAEIELLNLKYSRTEIRAATTLVKFLPQLQLVGKNPMSLSEQYFFFRGVGKVFPALAVLAVALGISIKAIAPLINRYFNPEDQVAHPVPLLTGTDLMRSLNLPSGPKVGQLLLNLGLARAEGKISTSAEALKLASELSDLQG